MARSVQVALLITIAACSAQPFDDAGLPECGEGQNIYLPPAQGPDAARAASTEAMDCFVSALAAGDEVVMNFVLLGTEGQRFDASLRTHGDGTVDYFREEGGLGASSHYACTDFSFEPPGFPAPMGCSSRPPTSTRP